MENAIVLRTAGLGDVLKLVRLINEAFAMERAFVDRDRTSVPEINALFRTGTFLVSDANPDALAACMYLERRGDSLYLGMLSVSPSQQGRGIGKQMMAAAESHCLALGCRAIAIRIVNRRTELPPFYRRLGFEERGTESFDDPMLTKPCHFLLMSKELTAPVN